MRLKVCLALLLFCGGNLDAQLGPPTVAPFKASLITFQTQSVDWQRAINNIKVDDLPVSYAEGKVIEQNKQLALQNLQLASNISIRIHQSESLSDEINLLATVQDTEAELQALEALLLDTNVADAKAKVVVHWVESLTKITSGPLNEFYINTFKYVTAHADEVESRCPSKS